MYDLAVPPVLQALGQGQRLLAMATPEMLQARLAPGMFDCAAQFAVLASFGIRATFPMTTLAAPTLSDDPAEALATAIAAVAALSPADFTGSEARIITHRAGFADLTQPAPDYLQRFALPNLWFHLAMAFAILRQEGLQIGKADFDGLHAYPQDFTFDD